jgi:hypothetical protein
MRTKAPLAVLSAACLLAACSGGGGRSAAAPSQTPSPTASPTATAIVIKPVAAVLDPLTGTAPASKGKLVGIKVDNAVLARPYQTGLGRAAVVYEELVEGGSTRLLAVYESDLAGSGEVGPIRSVRESDIELVRAFGTMALGFSGGNTGVKAILRSAARSGHVVDASYDAVPGAYRLGAQRRDARNFFTSPSKLAELRPGTGPRDIGFRFGPAGASGVATASAVAAFSPQTRVGLRWNPGSGTWSVSQNGRLMPGVAPSNIIVQRVAVRGSRFVDVHGMPTPYTVTVGSGSAVILRDGKRYGATWKRTGRGATRYLNTAGKDVLLRPGKTWVLLVPRSGSVSFG